MIEAIEDINQEFLKNNVVFGQYGNGIIDDVPVVGYREEDNIPENSKTETFVALKLHINNFAAGTPFLSEPAKGLGRYGAEIVIQLRFAEYLIF